MEILEKRENFLEILGKFCYNLKKMKVYKIVDEIKGKVKKLPIKYYES